LYTADPLLAERHRVGKRTVISVRWILVGVWCWVFAIHAAFYLLLVPPWQVPDEPTSVELLLTMQAKGRLVGPTDKDPTIEQEIIASMDRTRYWELGAYGYRPDGRAATFEYIYPCCHTQLHRPALYQALFLPAAYATNDWPIEQRLLVFRSLTLMMGVITVAVVTLISYELRPLHPTIPLILPALVALHPQFAYSSAGFNSDNLVALIGALLFLVLLRVLRFGLSPLRLASIVLLIVTGFLSKRTMLFVLPSVGVAVLWGMFRSWRTGSRTTRRFLAFATTGGIFVLFIVSVVPPFRDTALMVLKQVVFQAGLAHYRSFVFERLIWLPPWLLVSIPFLNKSFWGSFGWHQLHIDENLHQMLMWVVGAGWVSACLGVVIRRRQMPYWCSSFIWTSFLAVTFAIIITLINAPQGILPQGRYLFIVLVPIMGLLAFGLVWWLPKRITTVAVSLVWLALIAFDCYTLGAIIIPGFYR
jgi:hypothetical protein